jgi:hypothetical protein
MTSTPSHQAGNSRRDQLTSALVVGAVLVVLGAASGLGIEVTSSALPRIKPPSTGAMALPAPQPQPSATGSTPINYIGVPGPGNLPNLIPGIVSNPGDLPSARPDSSAKPSTSTSTSTSAGSTPTASPSSPTNGAPSTSPNLNCPSDVVTGLLDVLLGNNGLLGSSALLKAVLNLLPNLANLLKGSGLSSVLTTNVGNLSAAQTNSMAQACTPVLSGLLGGSG